MFIHYLRKVTDCVRKTLFIVYGTHTIEYISFSKILFITKFLFREFIVLQLYGEITYE